MKEEDIIDLLLEIQERWDFKKRRIEVPNPKVKVVENDTGEWLGE